MSRQRLFRYTTTCKRFKGRRWSMQYGVRGAITVEDNTEQAIRGAVETLIETLLRQNQIATAQIVSVFFTVTPDLTALNPASAIRSIRPDWHSVPLLCSQEPVITGMLPACIRVLVQWEAPQQNHPVHPVYLGNAKQLRPDL